MAVSGGMESRTYSMTALWEELELGVGKPASGGGWGGVEIFGLSIGCKIKRDLDGFNRELGSELLGID